MTPSLRLDRLDLTGFRSYPALTWRPGGDLVVVTGPNGSGKTNLLEAISLLVPGRGLRGTRLSEVAHRAGADAAPSTWAVAGRFSTPMGPAAIGTGVVAGAPDRRAFQLDGQPARGLAAISERLSAVWLTPAMDGLLTGGASGRRRFLDRLAFALDPAHARQVAAHDHAVAQRNRLLARPRAADPAWLAGAEDAIARHAVAVTAARATLVAGLNDAFEAGAVAPFPAARLALPDPIATRLATVPAVEVEDHIRATLAAGRARDAAAGTTRTGAHRADLDVRDARTGRPASEASTGQQKTLLISLVLGHAGLIASARGFSPLLLLDEPIVHLDAFHRAALFDALADGRAQAFITGTDAEPFAPLARHSVSWMVGDGALTSA